MVCDAWTTVHLSTVSDVKYCMYCKYLYDKDREVCKKPCLALKIRRGKCIPEMKSVVFSGGPLENFPLDLALTWMILGSPGCFSHR